MDIIESIASVTKAAVNAGNHELFKELQEISEQAYRLQKENIELKDRIIELEKIISDDKSKTLKDGCYYFEEDGPFCTCCYDDLKKKIRVSEVDNNMGTIHLKCPKCSHEVLYKNYDISPETVSPLRKLERNIFK